MPQFYFSQVAASVPYDHAASGLAANDVQAAIDEMKALVGSGTASLPIVQSQRTTDATFTTSWADVTIDQTDYENDPSIINHDDASRAIFRILEAGYYQLSYQFTAVETGGARLSSRLFKNGSAMLLGSDRFMEVGTDVLNAVCVDWFEAGDYFTLQLLRAGGSTGLAYANMVVYAIKLGGAKGEKGDVGSGSNIAVQSHLVDVPNTPHSTINVDGPLTATDVGGGNVTISQYIQSAESLALSTTTATTYQDKLVLTTPSLPVGTYRVGWSYDWCLTNISYNFQARVVMDSAVTAGGFVIGRGYTITSVGSTNFTLIGASANTVGVYFVATGVGTGTGQAEHTLMTQIQEPEDAAATQRQPLAGFAYVTLTAGVHVVNIRYCTSNAGGTARIWDARLEIWRVS